MSMLDKKADRLAKFSHEPASQLILACAHCIEQCQQLLELISAEDYVKTTSGNSSLGAHIRHVIDRFHCFCNGLPDSSIDFDARKRDREVESNLEAASFSAASVSRRMQKLGQGDFLSKAIKVRESVHHQHKPVTVQSTIERELMGLITHSIHHLALIALIARSYGYSIDSDFGKAPSTIAYERG